MPYISNTKNDDNENKNSNKKTRREIIMITTIKIMTQMKMINVIRHSSAEEHWRPVWASEKYFLVF